jgi:hypothetical protein
MKESTVWRLRLRQPGKELRILLHFRMLGRLLNLLSLTLLLNGCVVPIPIPSFSTKPECGEKLTAARTAFIEPGKTTKAEIIRSLGTNFTSLPQGRAVAYTWEIPGGRGLWLFATFAGGAAGEFEWSHWRGFFVAVDNRGVVTATAFKRLWSRHSLDEQMDRWVVKITSKIAKTPNPPNSDFSTVQITR